ncbi:TetR family transcriptional regulator [Streptomyces sp. NPDC059874]|uniref:TetR family transcriptional regulator n=1 Tax=Streptomyces sp. NPDC059874 TaxID=3346983 RepID=UPI003663C22E
MGGRGTSRNERSAERREAILNVALEVFAERGYHRASLAVIADRVGLTQQGVLHYFGSKEGLLQAVLDRRDELDHATLGPRSGGTAAARDAIVRLLERDGERRGIVQCFAVLAADSVTEDHPAQDYFRDRYARIRTLYTEIVRADYGDLLPSGVTPEQAATLLIAVVDGMRSQWLLDPDEVDMPALFGTLAELLGSKAHRPACPPPSDG